MAYLIEYNTLYFTSFKFDVRSPVFFVAQSLSQLLLFLECLNDDILQYIYIYIYTRFFINIKELSERGISEIFLNKVSSRD